METTITFTPSELVIFITTVCGAIVTVGTAITIIYKLFRKMRVPEETQNARLDALEKENKEIREEMKILDSRLKVGDDHFKEIEVSSKITQQGVLALLKHALNGDAIEDLKDAEKNLEIFLINK